MKKYRMGIVVLRRALLLVLLTCPLLATSGQTPPSQVQVARRFLLAVVRGEWAVAYQWLAPQTRQELSPEEFRIAAQPFIVQSQRYGPVIDLYKLGYRLRGEELPQPFVAFSLRADTLRRLPHFQLDVTFRDSTARQVQGFGLVPLVPVVPIESK